MQVTAVFLAQLRSGIETAQIATLAGLHVEKEQKALVCPVVGIGVTQHPAGTDRRERHMAVFHQYIATNHFHLTSFNIVIEVVVNLAGMWPPDNDVLVVLPQGMRDLVLRLFIVKRAYGTGVEVVSQLRQRMIGALQQAHVRTVRVHGDQAMQKAGLILHTFCPSMQKQDARRSRVDLDMADPVDGLVHRRHMMECLELLIADQQPGITFRQLHAPDAVICGRQRQFKRLARLAVTNGLVRDVQAPVVDRQRPGTAGCNHIHGHGQNSALLRIHIHHHGAKARVTG